MKCKFFFQFHCWLSFAQPDLDISLDIQVILIGFNGDSNENVRVDTTELQSILKDNLPFHKLRSVYN